MGGKNQTTTSNGTSNGTSTTTLSPQVQAAYNALLGQIGGGASGANAATTSATNGLNTVAGTSNPNFASAATTLGGASAPASASIGDYLSPYLTGALQTQIASQNQQNQQQQQGVVGNAIAQGALGGNRVAVAQGQLAGQQALANNQANSGLINSAYQQAENAALQGQSNQTAAGTAQGNLGASQTGSSLDSLLALLQAGNSQIGNLGTLSGAASNLSNTGATTTSSGTTTGSQTVPNGNILSQLLGAGTAIAGLFKAGGVVPGYDDGGAVASELTSERNSGLLGALSAAQGSVPQTQAQDQSPNFSPNAEQKTGIANLKDWFMPTQGLPGGVGETGGLGSSYATGGVVGRRGYDDGGYVPPDSGIDLGALLSSILGGSSPPSRDATPAGSAMLDQIAPSNDNAAPAANDNSAASSAPAYVRPPMAVNSGLVPPVSAVSPMTMPSSIAAARSGLTPVSLAATPVPLAPLPTAAPSTARVHGIPLTLGQQGAADAGGFGAAPTSGVVAPTQGLDLGSAASAIRSMESGSPSGNYGDVGPATKTGDHAYGAYQVMGANIPSWTAQYYGKTLTPQQFLANPEAQDAVFKGQFSSYADDYGPDGAAKAWFAGRGGMGNPDAADVNGTTVKGYGQQFDNLYGKGTPATSGVVASSPQSILASDAGFGRPVAPNPANGPAVASNGTGFNPSAQNSPNIGSVVSSLMAGKGTGLSDPVRAALISAGLGIMGGTNSNALVNVGQGAQAGFRAYNDLQAQNATNAATQATIAQQAAEALRTKVATANEATNYQGAGAGMFETHVDPVTGQKTIQRVPYSAIPVAGQEQGQSPAAPTPDANGFTTTAPDMTSQLPMLANTDAGLAQLQTQGRAYTEPAQQDAMAAHKLDLSLGQLSSLTDALPDSGPLTQGAGFGARAGFANSLNTAFSMLGVKPIIDPSKVSTAEDVNKLATQLQAAVATSWKTDPAASTIMQAGSASPSGENTKQGFKRIVANIQAVNKRAEDRAAFLTSWQNQNMGVMSTANGESADDVFNQQNPPSKYIDYGEKLASAVVPKTQADIDGAPKGTVFNVNGALMVK